MSASGVRIQAPFNPARRRAFSLVEAVISIVIVGAMLAAALNTLGASKVGLRGIEIRGQGAAFAQQLMAEILSMTYQEPVDLPVLGTEPGEATSNRMAYDDVDDYDGWTASPVQRGDGAAISNDLWRRSVEVKYVLPGDPSGISGSDQGLKRITVTVEYNGIRVASLVALRTALVDNIE